MMNSPLSFETLTPWMAQLVDPKTWQAWMESMQSSAEAKKTATESINTFNATTNNELPNAANYIDTQLVQELQTKYMQEFAELVQDLAASKIPVLADKRFKAPAWQSNALHAFNAALYLLNARSLLGMADAFKAAPKMKQKIRFAIQQMVDAMSPANFLVTNPDAQRKVVETKGESLQKGIALMLADLKKGRISQTDENAFEVGVNVAMTPGMVVFENELFQLIQYTPIAKTVFERPLLMVPPCINKFYILDLQPENSLVRYAVNEGHTVFLVSWRNPDQSLGNLTWDDYVEQGILTAIDTVKSISEQDQINALGFCVGGTLLSTGLAVMAARGQQPVASLSLLTTFLDFSDTGVMDVFIDEVQVNMREQAIGNGGLMKASDFTSTFSSLRPNDLIWNYVGSNYLKGEEPLPFDLLYWNADGTNLPGPMFCWYLRHTYLENNLCSPGKITVLGETIDFGKIDVPTFLYASKDDHIVPWQSAYQSHTLLNPTKPKQNRFVLGASGHIAGVINAPSKNKRNYWINPKIESNPADWLEAATESPGSWWTPWSQFLSEHSGKRVPASHRLGNDVFKPIEAAPGRYVKVKLP
jgi:polyhydroxyalkanoate synthase